MDLPLIAKCRPGRPGPHAVSPVDGAFRTATARWWSSRRTAALCAPRRWTKEGNVSSTHAVRNISSQSVNVLRTNLTNKSSANLNLTPAENQHCVFGDWSDWMPCTQSCGSGGMQQRMRMIKSLPPAGANACAYVPVETRACPTSPPCENEENEV